MGSASVTPASDPLVQISPHVSVHASDPALNTLREEWNEVSSSWWTCLHICGEAVIWGDICNSVKNLCSSDFMKLVAGGDLLGDPFGGPGGVVITLKGEVRSLRNPFSMRGATEEEFLGLAKSSGLKVEPMAPTAATGGRGWRAYDPANKSVNAFWEAGDSDSRAGDVVHRGPYIKWQVGKDSYRVPGAGNPNPESGNFNAPPPAIVEWGAPSELLEIVEAEGE